MAFDFSTLVTDRKQSDVVYVKQLTAKIVAGTATEPELAEWKSLTLKGAYNYTDLNRVSTALEYLRGRLNGYGYATPGYQRIEVPHRTVASSKLPDGYTEVAYIESSGTQYIDTEFVPNQDTRIVMDAQVVSIPSNGVAMLFGGRTGTSTDNFCSYYRSASSGFVVRYGDDNNTTNVANGNPTTRYVFDLNKNVLTLDNGSTLTRPTDTFTSSYSLCLMAIHSAGEVSYHTPIKLYSCQIYDNGTLVRDYVPVKDETGNVGLYDIVESKFYGNAGTGAFIAGPIPVELPDGYTQVEYIESHGTEYIDPDVAINSNTYKNLEFVIDNYYPQIGGSVYLVNGCSGAGVIFYCGLSNNVGGIVYGNGTQDIPASKNSGVGRQTITFSPIKKQYKFGEVQNLTGLTFNAPTGHSNFYLFAYNTGTNAVPHIERIYSCQIYDNGTLVRDFVPCKNPDGAYGLYDVANSKFYGNAGSGAFTVGAVVDPPVPSVPSDDETRDPFLWYEDDIPTAAQMAQYSLNVAVVRGTLEVLSTTPAAPSAMEGLTVEGANAIEFILIDVETLINNMAAAWFYSGDLYSGEV